MMTVSHMFGRINCRIWLQLRVKFRIGIDHDGWEIVVTAFPA